LNMRELRERRMERHEEEDKKRWMGCNEEAV
jgi:hypothetical protein